ncbi:MAG: sugar transferase (PEP-CTERM/EpsH1 system associated) [Bacteroidia bacterium]
MSDRPPLVVHIIYMLSSGGLENGLVNIINRCPTDRYRHAIISLTTADHFAERITVEGVEIFQLHKREGHDLAMYRRLRALLQELRPDIVHSRNMAALEAQLSGFALRGIKRVHGEHGREVGDVDGTNRKYLLLRRFMRLFMHRYITVSKDLERWLIASVGVRPEIVTQVYNGVDSQKFTPATVKPLALLPRHWQERDDILVVGTVGRLTPVKDQQLLLRALAQLCRQHPDLADRLRLLMVGDGPLREQLTQLSAELGIDEQVWWAGDRADIPELLGAIDVFVLPSLGEGISNTVLEAMACGLPVVATAIGGNLELVEPGVNGELFPVGDEQALVDVLAGLLRSDTMRKRLGDNARKRVTQGHNWDSTVAQYLDVYDALIGRSTIEYGKAS